MKSSPLLLNSLEDAGCRLNRVEAQPHDPRNEAWLQELLYSHPELLPIDEFDESYTPAIPVGREVGKDRNRIDNLYVSPEGGITIVETKLWKNPDKHRTVVAQVIDYAKEVATWDYDEFCQAILASSRKRGENQHASLEEKVAPALAEAGMKLHEFQENVASCLREGNFLLLIVGDRISPNIALLTRAIQGSPGLGFKLGLAEMQLYQLEDGNDWPLIVVPEVVGRTVERTRGVIQVRYSVEKPVVDVEFEDEEGDGSTVSGGLNLESFLSQVPKDLVEPFREGVYEWEKIGGKIHFTNKMMHFQIGFPEKQGRPVRCRTSQVTISRHMAPKRRERYLKCLEASPVVHQHALADRQWVRYDKISGDDLRVLLQAAKEFAEDKLANG